MKSNTALAILLGAATVGFVAWQVHAVLTTEPPQYEIVEDHSGSHGPACASLRGLAGQALDSPGATPGSALTILLLGDHSTANEPRRIGTYPIPVDRRVAEGPHEIVSERAAILDEIGGICQTLPQTNISPIFLGVKQAVADLRARGCGIRSQCSLVVDSDLQENVELSIKRRLNGSARGPALPQPIDNAGINVDFCGYAVALGNVLGPMATRTVTVPPRNANQDARLQESWRSLFSESSAVAFEPYCPTPVGK